MKKEIRTIFNEKYEKPFHELIKSLAQGSGLSESDFTKFCYVKVAIKENGKVNGVEDLKEEIAQMRISLFRGIFKLVGVPKILLDPKVLDSMSHFLQHQIKNKEMEA